MTAFASSTSLAAVADSRFAIVIVNWNSGDLLRQCLESIARCANHYQPEVIVVDNSSADDSVERAAREHPDAKILQSGGNVGFARACNLGASQAQSQFLIFLNPDALLQPGTLPALDSFLRANPGVGAVGCKVRDAEGHVQELGVQRDPTPLLEFLKALSIERLGRKIGKTLLPRQDPLTSGRVSKLYGACLVVDRELYESVGGFDGRFFMYCEDVDLCRRILDAGRSLYYLAEAEIVHNQGSCSKKAPSGFSVLMQCESLSKYTRKYHGAMGASAYRFLAAVAALLRFPFLTVAVLAAGGARKPDSRRRWFRNLLVLRWAVFAARPFVPS